MLCRRFISPGQWGNGFAGLFAGLACLRPARIWRATRLAVRKGFTWNPTAIRANCCENSVTAGRIQETSRQERGQPCPRELGVKPGTRGHGCPRLNPPCRRAHLMPRTADGPRPQHVGPLRRTAKTRSFCAWPSAANRDGSQSVGGSPKKFSVLGPISRWPSAEKHLSCRRFEGRGKPGTPREPDDSLSAIGLRPAGH